MRTEVQTVEENPIYFNSFTFSSSNMSLMKYKVMIYQTKNASIEKANIEESRLIGEGEFEIGELLKLKKTGVVFLLQLPETEMKENRKKNKILKKSQTTCTVRYEMIEQTNTNIKAQFKVIGGLSENFLLYKLSRIREMSDYVVFYTSKR